MKTGALFLLIMLLGAWHVPSSQPLLPSDSSTKDTVYRSITNNAWQGGEILEYRVHYGMVSAGNITMTIEKDLVPIKTRNTYHIHAEGKSVSGFDWFYKVRDHFETYIDNKAIVPHQFVKKIEEGSYKDSDFAIFNHAANRVSSARKGVHEIPDDIQDIISGIYYARTIDISKAKAGDLFPINIYLDGEIHELKIKYVGKEKISTSLGTINAVKIIPMVIADRVFKDQEGLELWVSDDENKLPLRVRAEVLVGSIKVDIIKADGLKHPLNK